MGAIHWHGTKGWGVRGETAEEIETRFILCHPPLLLTFEGHRCHGHFLFFYLYSPGQLFPPPNEITKSTNQSAMTDWKEKKKKTDNLKINFRDVWGVWYVICIFFLPALPVTKTCDKWQRSATHIHSGDLADDFSDLCLIAQRWHRQRRHDVALWCVKQKVFSVTRTWQRAGQKTQTFHTPPLLRCSPSAFWSFVCYDVLPLHSGADEIRHRLSHLLCLRLICLLAGSHQSLLQPGGFPRRRAGSGLGGQLGSMIRHISH